MLKKLFLNKSIMALFVLLSISLLATLYLSIIQKKNIENFSNRGVDTISWPFFQVERNYYEIEKLLIKHENNISEIDLDEFSNYFDVYLSTYKNLEGRDYQPFIFFNCSHCAEKELLENMKKSYIDLGEELKKIELLATDGWTQDEFKLFLEKNNDLIQMNSMLSSLANQKSAIYNSYKQEEIIGIEKIMISLFIFQVICFILFASFSLFYIRKLTIAQVNLQKSYDTISISREEILQAYQSRTQLLARLSHEIRTPLNSIQGFSQVMESDRENPLNEEQMSNLQLILKSSDLVINLVNQILDFSRMEAGKIDLNYDNFRVSEVVDEVNSLLQTELNNNNIKLVYEFTNHFIYADSTKTKQIIINLITNAIKYGDKDAFIVFETKEEEEGFISFSVNNTGPSISKENQPFLFTEFYRADYSDSAIKGHGIGLSVCKKLSEIMGGSISFISENNSTTFTVKLPKGQPSSLISENNSLIEGDSYNSEEVTDISYYLVIISEHQRHIDSILNTLKKYKKVKHISVPDTDFAKDIISYSNVQHVLYSNNLVDSDFKSFMLEKKIEFLSYDLDGVDKDSISEKDLDNLFKRWFI